MNGIDISKWQGDIDLAKVPCDFVIVKATQGTKYVSATFKKQIEQAISLGKYVGVYHYASSGGYKAEAEHFLNTVRDYLNRAILILDWEGQDNVNFSNPYYAMDWLKYVKDITGITPFIYMSKSVCRQYNWDSSYPLWCAQYANKKPTGYQANPWTDTKGFGAWDKCKILQYSSTGRLEGYNDNLDIDKAYMDGDEWLRWATGDLLPEPQRPILRKGDRNEYVRSWQIYLTSNGYDVGKAGADGWFGDDTEKAVMRYQQDHQIEAGYVGSRTWATLN